MPSCTPEAREAPTGHDTHAELRLPAATSHHLERATPQQSLQWAWTPMRGFDRPSLRRWDL